MTMGRLECRPGLLEVRIFDDAAHVDAFHADKQGELSGVLYRFRE
jgi:hypothetical protein